MAVTFDAKSTGKLGAAGTTTTVAHTVGAGTHRLLTVLISRTATITVATAVTYGGVALTKGAEQVGSGGTAADAVASIWYLIDPTPGTANVVVTHPSSTGFRIQVASFISDGLLTPGTGVGAQGDSTTAAVSVTPAAAGALIVDAVVYEAADVNTRGASQVALYEVNEGTPATLSSYALNMPASAYSMSHTTLGGVSTDWVIAALAFTEAAAALGHSQIINIT